MVGGYDQAFRPRGSLCTGYILVFPILTDVSPTLTYISSPVISGDQSWSVVTTKGSVPEARSSAGMAAVENKLYLFGGLSQNSGWFEDVYSYDIGKLP